MSIEVLRNSLNYLPAKIVPAAVGLLSIPIYTNLMPPDIYGNYVLILSTLNLISALCISWLVSVVLRFNIIHGLNNLHQNLRTKLLFCLITGCLIWFLINQFFLNSLSKITLLVIGAIWLITQGVYEYFTGLLRATNLATKYSIAISWRSIGCLTLSTYLLWLGLIDVSTMILSFAIVMLFGLFFLPKSDLITTNNNSFQNFDPVNNKDLIKYGIPAAITNILTLSLSLIDRFFINSILGPESVAIYSASYEIAEKPIFFLNSMLLLSSSVIGYRIFEKDGETKALHFITKLMQLYLIIAPPIVVILCILSSQIIKNILPSNYYVGIDIIPIVSFGAFFVGIMHRYSLILAYYKRADIIMYCYAVAVAVNIMFCWLMIPLLGLVGAAISTLIAYCILCITVWIASKKFARPSFPWKTFLRVFFACLFFYFFHKIFIIFFDNNNLLVNIFEVILVFFLYFLFLIFIREVNLSDVKSIFS